MAAGQSTAVSGDDTSADARAFFQERLRFFVRTMAALFAAMLGLALGVVHLFPYALPPHVGRGSFIALQGVASLVALWLFLRWKPRSLFALRAIDAVIMVTAGLQIGGASLLVLETPAQVFVPFTVAVLLLFARVFTIPSSATRTLVLSTICFVPVSIGNVAAVWPHRELLGMPFTMYAAGGIVIAGSTIALATTGTSVLYGLRKEVREAKRYGQYTIDRKLGEGGMGVVYLARHTMLRRPTALKLLPSDKAGADDIARFEREVQLTSELTHPNTIAIYDYGRSVDGAFYYVMEFLDGIDLESLVERVGALPPARVVRILRRICGSLEEAHARRMIHRDIKPANVILCRRGQVPDFVKVVDFGLVKELARDETVTQAGTITGTPAYLAPEAMTDPENVGPAADLYAVGALGYFLVTGKMVFDGKSVLEICSHHLHTTPAAPSKRIDRPIPAALESLLLGCLAKKPEERPASARALGVALAEIDVSAFTDEDANAWWEEFEKVRVHDPAKHDALAETVVDSIGDTIAVLPRPPG